MQLLLGVNVSIYIFWCYIRRSIGALADERCRVMFVFNAADDDDKDAIGSRLPLIMGVHIPLPFAPAAM